MSQTLSKNLLGSYWGVRLACANGAKKERASLARVLSLSVYIHTHTYIKGNMLPPCFFEGIYVNTVNDVSLVVVS